eukprot:773978_1
MEDTDTKPHTILAIFTDNNGEDEYSDSDTISSYDSDDDEAHVAHHYSRKTQSAAYNKKKNKKKHETSSSLFKPHELDQWDDSRLEDEQAAMLKQLSRLMMGAVAATDQQVNNPISNPRSNNHVDVNQIDGMTHKRQNTLKTLLDVTTQPNGPNGNSNTQHELKKSISSISSNRIFSVTD